MEKTKGVILCISMLYLTACQSTKLSQREYLGHNHSYKHANDSAPDLDTRKLATVQDAVPRYEPKSRYGNPSSYSVKNRTYQVLDSNKDFSQHGLASWYGKKFHGFKTSNGEVYDMYEMTAAHKTLPIPSYVEVKNLENGRSTIVRVNDRGPFHGNERIIDLSYAAAHKLGVIANGTAKVRITAIDNATLKLASKQVPYEKSNPKVVQQATFLQLGAFGNIENARGLAKKASEITESNVRIIESGSIHKVQLGPITEEIDINSIQSKLQNNGITPGIRMLSAIS